MCEKLKGSYRRRFCAATHFIGQGCNADCQGAAGGLHRSTRSSLAGKFTVVPNRIQLTFILVCMVALFPQSATTAPKTNVEPTPPQPMEQKVNVKRGGSVDIPLRIYGTRAQTLTWIIRQHPAHGKLSGIRATAPEAAVVTYRPPADLAVVSDRFTFSVRSNEGVSAAAEVTIAITDDEPRIVAPSELEFGTLLAGASAVKTLDFTNAGGGIADGAIKVDAPWRIEGARHYKLPAGGRHVVKVIFAPERAGKSDSEVQFTSQPDRVVSLRGVAEDALAVEPAKLVLAQSVGFPLRAASFELRNNTDVPVEVAVAASPRLVLRRVVPIPAGGSATVSVQAAEKDVAAIDESIRFTAGVLAARLPVRAAALPGLVRARPGSVAFGRVGAREAAKQRIFFDNQGGTATKVKLAVGPPFSLTESEFSLAPGAEKEVVVTVAGASNGTIQSVLKVTTDTGGFDIPIDGNISPNVAAVPASRRQAVAASAPREPDPTEAGAAVSGPFAATILSIGENAATFQWQGTTAAGAKLHCLLRSLSTDENGELLSALLDYPACKIERGTDGNVATVGKLEPAKTYLFVITATTPEGSTPVTFAQIRTPDRPPRAPIFTLVRILCALALVTGGASIWQRTRGR